MPEYWPGSQQGYMSPPDAFIQSTQREPMYAGYMGPRYTGPANIQIGQAPELSMVMQLIAPQLLQFAGGPDNIPFQFMPQQSAYDQLVATQNFNRQMEAVTAGSRRDQATIADFLGGINQMMTGEPLDNVRRARNQRIAEGVTQVSPMLMQILGPELMDQLHGSRGSAAVLGAQLSQAFRTQADPVTGRLGFSGRSVGSMTEEIFAQIESNPAAMRGMSAGRAGVLVNELQQRGFLGSMVGNVPMEERLAALPSQIRDDQVARIAERIPSQPDGRSLSEMRAANEEITDTMIKTARDRVKESFRQLSSVAPAISNQEIQGIFGGGLEAEQIEERRKQLRRGLTAEQRNEFEQNVSIDAAGTTLRGLREKGVNITDTQRQRAATEVSGMETRARRDDLAQQIRDLPGGEDVIRMADADRINSRLKNMSGAVAAMREIFGDMGRPNAPMRELINGLEALTQGGLATMTPDQIENTVRRTQAIANQTGVGVQSQLGMMAANAQLADRLGLDRSFATTVGQQGAVFGAAVAETQRLDMPTWGALNREQLMLADQQLRMHAAASPMANQLGALMRLQERGFLDNMDPNSELAALTQATQRGDTSYTFDGQQQSVGMNRTRFQEMLLRDANITHTQSWSAISDRMGNQEMIQRFNLTELTRRFQTGEAAMRMLSPNISGRISGTFEELGIGDILQDRGVVQDRDQYRAMMDEVGRGVAREYFNIAPEDMRDPARRQVALGGVFRDQLKSAIRLRQPGATEAQIEQLTSGVVDELGPRGLELMGSTVYDTVNQVAGRHPVFRSGVSMYDLLSQRAQQQAQRRQSMVEAEGLTRQALGGLAQDEPIKRIVDAFREATPGTSFREILSKGLGGVDMRQLAALDPSGQVQAMIGLLEETQAYDPTDPRQMDIIRRNARVIQGIVEGGDTAKQVLQELEGQRSTIKSADATTAQRREALERLEAWETTSGELVDRKRELRRSKFRNQILRGAIQDISAGTGDPARAADLIRAGVREFGDIAMGGNVFITQRGIEHRDAAGKVLSTDEFDDVAALTKGLSGLDKAQSALSADITQEERRLQRRSEAERLAEAEKHGFIRGAVPITDKAHKALIEAAEGSSDVRQKLEEIGYDKLPKLPAPDAAAAIKPGQPTQVGEEVASAASKLDQRPEQVAGIQQQSMEPHEITVKMTGTFREDQQGNTILDGVGKGLLSFIAGRLA